MAWNMSMGERLRKRCDGKLAVPLGLSPWEIIDDRERSWFNTTHTILGYHCE